MIYSWRKRAIVLAVLVFILSFSIRFLSLHQTPYANGWDGYFYINQIQALFEEGRMDVPDRSLIYPLLAGTEVLIHDYILSFKITVALLAALFSTIVVLLALRWSDEFSIGVVIGSFTLFSPQLTYFASQYPKNLLGLIFFVLMVYSADSKFKWLPFLFFMLNLFGHRVTVILSAFYLTLHFFQVAFNRRTIAIALVALLILAGAGFILPGLLNIRDLERLNDIFSAKPQFGPWSLVSSFGIDKFSILWLCEIVLCCVVFAWSIIAMIKNIKRKELDPRLLNTVIVLSVLIFPFLNWSDSGLALRLTLIFFLVCPLVLIFILKDLALPRVNWAFVILFAIGSLFSYKSYEPEKHDPPYALYEQICSRIVNVASSNCELIIAHKSLAEAVVFYTGIDAMSWRPEYFISNESLWRVATDVKDIHLRRYLKEDDGQYVHRVSANYVFIREDVWQRFLTAVDDPDILNAISTWRNPDDFRPSYLKR